MLMSQPNPTLDTSLSIRRIFAASREEVFRAWTDPQAIERWFKPMGLASKVTLLDLRVGGGFRFDLESPAGERSFITGNYLEIAAPEKLVFTWSSLATHDRETLVTVEFVARGTETEIVLTHERLLDEDMISAHQNGWASVLDQLTAAL
jgi:uncharacterized protein YndB with AHSA1/START domain